MGTGLDGIVIAVDDLAVGRRDFAQVLGFEPESVEVNEAEAACVFDLGNTTLELRARERTTSPPASEGIAGLRFAFDPAPDVRFAGGPVAGASIPIELVARARRAAGETDLLASTAGARRSGILGLDHVVVATRDPERARRLFGDELGLRLALDRRFPERGLRLLFFRVGGLTIEVAATLADSRDAVPADPADAFHGLALKVEGIEAVQARVAASGVAVSAVRDGFKPGTRVFGARTAVHGVPILWIEHPPRPGW